MTAYTAPTPQNSIERAISAYDAMQGEMYHATDGSSLYNETAPGSGNPYAYLWPFSRAFIGTLALAGIPSIGASYTAAVSDRLNGLNRYWDSSAGAYDSYISGSGADRYYDDNAWVALALLQQYRMGLTTSLSRAQQLFQFAQAGWDTVATDPNAGGVFWVQQGIAQGQSNHDRGAGANAGNAEVGLHLHDLTRLNSYDGDGTVSVRPRSIGALNMVNWVNQYLDTSHTGSGPFWNVARRDGSFDTNLWSYNQGVMIGARVLQYLLTRQTAQLRLAEAIARQTLSTYGDFTGQPPSFNAMCFQNMLMLYSATADATLKTKMLQTAQRYADWTWDSATGARGANNLFYFTDGGQPALGMEPRPAAKLQDQGAMVQLYSLLAWDAADYNRLT